MKKVKATLETSMKMKVKDMERQIIQHVSFSDKQPENGYLKEKKHDIFYAKLTHFRGCNAEHVKKNQ